MFEKGGSLILERKGFFWVEFRMGLLLEWVKF